MEERIIQHKQDRCYGSGRIEYGYFLNSQWRRSGWIVCRGCVDCEDN